MSNENDAHLKVNGAATDGGAADAVFQEVESQQLLGRHPMGA
jgi:hypothetical protein